MKFGKKTIALIGAVAMLSSVAACGSTSAGDSGSTGSSDKKIELTVWSWDSTLPRTVKGFEAKNPNIKVKVTNAGTNKDEYNALSNAIEAAHRSPGTDDLAIAQMKKEKLRLKEEITRLSD